MNLFENVIGRKIKSIQRIDQEEVYIMYQPYAIIIGFNDLDEKFLISATPAGATGRHRPSDAGAVFLRRPEGKGDLCPSPSPACDSTMILRTPVHLLR